jgi:hypothetical protein
MSLNNQNINEEKLECYICMEDNEQPLIKLPCACKNLPIHPVCLKEWLKVSYDILTCGICKSNISPIFIQKYVSLDDLLAYPYKSNMPTTKTYIGGNGIPYAELVNGKMVFETDNKRSIFFEAHKRNYMSERHKNKRYMK